MIAKISHKGLQNYIIQLFPIFGDYIFYKVRGENSNRLLHSEHYWTSGFYS